MAGSLVRFTRWPGGGLATQTGTACLAPAQATGEGIA